MGPLEVVPGDQFQPGLAEERSGGRSAPQSCQRGAEAEVDAITVPMRAVGEVKAVGVVDRVRVAVPPRQISTCRPAGISTPPTSVGVVANRKVASGTGASNLISPSIATGTWLESDEDLELVGVIAGRQPRCR